MCIRDSVAPQPEAPADVAALIPMLRRIVGARVGGHPAAGDLVHETLVRVRGASARIEPGMLEPYAIVTARNVIASMWRDDDRQKRNQHRIVDLRPPACLLYTSPSPRDRTRSRMPSSA